MVSSNSRTLYRLIFMKEKNLLNFIKERAYEQGSFKLSSGELSNYYIDCRMISVFSKSASLIGEIIYDLTKNLSIDAMGGPEVGAIPLTTATIIAYEKNNKKMEGFWVRNKTKDHGTQKLIEGNLQPNSNIVMLEDVITSGNSVMKAIEAVKNIDCKIEMILSLVDRDNGAKELFEKNGILNYMSIFKINQKGEICENY